MTELDMNPDHLRVVRACFALGEQGDWDPEAVIDELMRQNGIDRATATAMHDAAIAGGWITVSEPEQAEVIPFRRRP